MSDNTYDLKLQDRGGHYHDRLGAAAAVEPAAALHLIGHDDTSGGVGNDATLLFLRSYWIRYFR